MNEADAAARGLFDGDQVTVFNQNGSIEARVLIDNDMRPGAVAMSHGYGHRASYGMRVANRKPGANCNALLFTGADQAEPFSHMSWMTAVPVEVRALETAVA